MDETALKELLEQTGLPIAYSHYASPPPPPYLIYFLDRSENFGADDKVYRKISDYVIELYNTKKDPASEAQIESLFDDNDVYWEKTESWIESEKLFLVAYYI